jgi:hypothetical protein
MEFSSVTQVITILTTSIALAGAWYGFHYTNRKNHIELGKEKLELVDKIALALNEIQSRKLEILFTALTGTSAHGCFVKLLWSTNASIGQMPYLARCCQRYLKIQGTTVHLKRPSIGFSVAARLSGSIISMILAILVSLALTSGFTVIEIIAFLVIYLVLLLNAVRLLLISDMLIDAAALVSHVSSWRWVNRYIAARRLM